MSRSAQEEANIQLVLGVYEHVLKPLESRRVDDFFAAGYIQHNPMAETGAQGLKRFLDWARTTTPNARHHIKRVFVEGDHVIAHVHVIIDSHDPDDRGNAVVDIFRIEGGLVAEHWDVAQAVPEQPANANGVF